MGEFVEAALGYPAALLSFSLIVILGYWLLALLGAVGIDLLDADTGSGTEQDAGGFAGFVAGIGLGGVPVTISLSLLIAVAWFVSLVGTVVLGALELSTPVLIALGLLVLVLAIVVGWVIVSLIAMFVRRTMPETQGSSRSDFVGQTCVIRTPPLGEQTGQAEITSPDGSSAIIQVRRHGTEELSTGATALVFDYDTDGEFFWVSYFDLELGPGNTS